MAEVQQQVAGQKQPVAVQQEMTKWQALREIGWLQTIDIIIMVLVGIDILGIITTAIAGKLTMLLALVFLAVIAILMQAWNVILSYRASAFILTTQADINLMPQAAARIVLGYYNSAGAVKK